MAETATRTADSEDFPVAPFFLPGKYKQLALACYRFARTGDDIADNPKLSVYDRMRLLDDLESGLDGEEDAGLAPGLVLHTWLKEHGLEDRWPRAMLGAFRDDVTRQRFRDYTELRGYYELSANPAGRFLADLMGVDPEHYRGTDAVSTGLGLVTNLRDVKWDLAELDRIYVPLNAMEHFGVAESDLCAHAANAATRKLIAHHVGRAGKLFDVAEKELNLPGQPMMFRLLVGLASSYGRALGHKLIERDPLVEPVGLSKLDRLLCFFRALGFML